MFAQLLRRKLTLLTQMYRALNSPGQGTAMLRKCRDLKRARPGWCVFTSHRPCSFNAGSVAVQAAFDARNSASGRPST